MYSAGIIKRSLKEKERIDSFIEQLVSSRLTYIFIAESPFREAVKYVRELMKHNSELDFLPILQKHRMYFEIKIKETQDDVW